MEFGYFTLSDNAYPNNPRSASDFVLEIREQALVDEVLELAAGVELVGGRGIAGHHPADRRLLGVAAAGDGIVDPLAASGVVGLGEFSNRGGLALRWRRQLLLRP